MRAVENGYAMAPATGNGESLIVDDQGRILGAQRDGEGGGVMIADLPTRGAMTIYARVGDVFAYLCAAALIAFASFALFKRD